MSETKDYRIIFRLKGPTSYYGDGFPSYVERTSSTIVKAKSKQDARKMLKGTDEFRKLSKTVRDLDETGSKPRLRRTIVEEVSKKRGAKGGGGGPIDIKTVSGKPGDVFKKTLKAGGGKVKYNKGGVVNPSFSNKFKG
jgi:hypothetical protein